MSDENTLGQDWTCRLEALRHIPVVLRMVWESGKLLTACTLAFRGLVAVVPVSMLWVSKLILDVIVHAVSRETSIPDRIWLLLVTEFALACSGIVLTRLIDYCDGRLTDRFTRLINIRIIAHASQLDLVSFETPNFYDRLERARAQATDRIEMLSGIGRLGQEVVSLLSLSVGVVWFSPWLMLLLTVCIIPAFLGESHFAFQGYSLSRSLTPEQRQLDYLRIIGTTKETAKEIRVFGLSSYFIKSYQKLSDRIYKLNSTLARRRLMATSGLAILGVLGHYGSYAFIVYETLRGKLSIGDMTFLAGAIARTSSNIQTVFSLFSRIADQALFLNDLVDFFAYQPSIISKPGALVAPRPIRKGFEFRHVSFHYPDSQRFVLRDINFRIAPGERIALVGENGQGKTTLVKLLARLYEPTEGVILLDDIDLREYRLEDLNKEIGIIFQDFVRYEISARENIGVGRVDDILDERRVIHAASQSGADAVIAKLRNGLNQMLGKRFESGTDLSGGEWQKFALARAYMRDAQILILDEPTASLDARSEYEVFQNFLELTQDRMTVLVSHRFSTVRIAQRILVLEAGQIREQGTHDELLEKNGRYAEFFNLQASGYR